MAKYFIFSNETNQLDYISDSEEKKNIFISGQTIYTAKEVTESQYDDVKLGKKTAQLNNGEVSVVDFNTNSFETISNTTSLEKIKERIKKFIQIEISNLHSKDIHNSEYEMALKDINVDSLDSVPNQTIPNWVLSKINISFKRPFEI